MRIQHNIMAMFAYRNYTNNVSAMKKNLEKLSSGYKINRAGDDAAGLAISEKMRAQITGLETAQKNAKDGISLVQTAEGALTEVHDMLNRMVELATQSANGTYDNETDRAQLQKEVDQLTEEIDRIADSSNFNGIKLLNGSMQEGFDTKTAAEAALTSAQNELAAAQENLANGNPAVEKTLTTFDELGLPAVWDGATPTPAQKAVDAHKTLLQTNPATGSKPKFSIELDGITHQIKDAGTDALTLKVGGQEIKDAAGNSITIAGGKGQTLTDEQLASLYNGAKVSISDGNGGTIDYTAKVENGSTRITFEADDEPAAGVVVNSNYDVAFTPVAADSSANSTAAQYTIDLTGLTGTTSATIDGETINFATDIATTAGNFVKAYNAANHDYTASVNGNVITLTQKVAGAVADADVPALGGTFKGMTATEMTEATAGVDAGNGGTAAVYTIDLTDGTEAGLDTAGATIDGVDITWNAANDDLQHTLEDFVATYNATAGKNYVASTDGSTVTLTARATGEVTNAPSVTNMGDIADDGSVAAITAMTEATAGVDGTAEGTTGTINVGTVDIHLNEVATEDRLANTVVNLSGKFTDGAEIKLGNTTYTIKLGADSKVADDAENVVDLSAYDGTETDFNAIAASALTVAAKDNDVFSGGQGATAGSITLQQLTSAKDDTDMETMDNLAGYIGVKSTTTRNMTDAEKAAATEAANKAVTDAEKALADAQKAAEKGLVGKSLTLQIGDTAEDFKQLKVDIKDMHAVSLGQEYDEDGNVIDAANLATIRIDDQTKAADAIDVIKRAINQVSDVRGTLGATQNRLDHTINNLSVMTENIQDAESTIRDVDVAEEMMAYTKNNILIQSAQAMLAQANQVPQGVLQLLG